jgi:hypothetical protein
VIADKHNRVLEQALLFAKMSVGQTKISGENALPGVGTDDARRRIALLLVSINETFVLNETSEIDETFGLTKTLCYRRVSNSTY